MTVGKELRRSPYGADDFVQLTVVLKAGFVAGGIMPRWQASYFIRHWWGHRMNGLQPPDAVPKDGAKIDTEEVAKSRAWLEKGTIAINIDTCDGKDERSTFATSAWAVSEVIGMYIQELGGESEARKRYFEKAAALIEAEKKRREEGEEWKKGGDSADSGDQ